MEDDKKLLFVYGSLLSGLHNHALLDNPESTLISYHTTNPEFTLVSLGSYPAVLNEGDTPIRGELYSVSQAVWEQVERLEGYPHYYGAISIPTPYGEARMYVLFDESPDNHLTVASGDWRDYCKKSFLYETRGYR